MGSRLGVIVKTSGGLETYYHQWAAGIDPQPTLYRLEEQEEVEFSNDQYDLYPWTIDHGNDPITVRLDTVEMITWRAIAMLDQITN